MILYSPPFWGTVLYFLVTFVFLRIISLLIGSKTVSYYYYRIPECFCSNDWKYVGLLRCFKGRLFYSLAFFSQCWVIPCSYLSIVEHVINFWSVCFVLILLLKYFFLYTLTHFLYLFTDSLIRNDTITLPILTSKFGY